MTKRGQSNIAASVRQRLLNITRQTGDDPNLVWIRYATERLLYRLSVSEYSEDFVLKGAMLFLAWTGQVYRPTTDMAKDFSFDGNVLAQAIGATFERRKTQIPSGVPLSLTDEFAYDEVKRVQWTAFLRKGGQDREEGLFDMSKLIELLKEFLLPPMNAAAGKGRAPGRWVAGGPWSDPAQEMN